MLFLTYLEVYFYPFQEDVLLFLEAIRDYFEKVIAYISVRQANICSAAASPILSQGFQYSVRLRDMWYFTSSAFCWMIVRSNKSSLCFTKFYCAGIFS